MAETPETDSGTMYPKVVGPDGTPPTFMCGNHQKPHIAKSIKQMMKLQSKKGCRKFYVIIKTQNEVLGGHGNGN
jgi:hypothetical protein